jgi:hypothetical protein
MCTAQRKWPRRVRQHSRSPAHTDLEVTVDTSKSSAPAHPPTDHDDTVEAHYSSLERPCACLEGWVFITYEDEYGEEREASYRCHRCADSH